MRGEKDSVTMSAHLISLRASSWPRGLFRSRLTQYLLGLYLPKSMLASTPGLPPAKGLVVLMTSSLLWLSTLTTVAPWSARYRELAGPTMAQAHSRILTASNPFFLSMLIALPWYPLKQVAARQITPSRFRDFSSTADK